MRILTLALMIALLAPVRLAALQKDADEAVGRRVAQAVRTYSRFTIFDDVTVHVEDQHVTLKGRVTLPVKKTEIGRRVERVDGVRSLANDIGEIGRAHV